MVTAAHCLAFAPPSLAFTLAMDVEHAGPTSATSILRTFVPPDFDTRTDGPIHDIGIAELVSPLSTTVPIDLNAYVFAAADEVELGRGTPVTSVGYGAKRTLASTIHRKDETHSLISAHTDHEIVVGGNGAPQSCVGDSGGPSFALARDGGIRIIGLVSRGVGPDPHCLEGVINSRMDADRAWLEATIQAVSSRHVSNPASALPPRI